MKVTRYFESLSQPNDTMFVEIDGPYRFTRRGQDWIKFREDLISLIKDTIAEDLADTFATETENWSSEEIP